MIRNDPLWFERYRPKTLDDVILKKDMFEMLDGYRQQKMIPNLILSGPTGCGKTSAAVALLNDIDADWIKINGSLERNIDTLRTTVHDFVRHRSLELVRKYVLIDEADYLNAQSTQPAMRAFIEEHSRNAGFILTCNKPHLLDVAIQGRCTTLAFQFQRSDMPTVGKAMAERLFRMLDAEKVGYDRKVVARLMGSMFPDMRKVVNVLQGYAQGKGQGKIDTGILGISDDTEIAPLFAALKARNFDAMRTWVGEHASTMPVAAFARLLYDNADRFVEAGSVPQFVIYLGELLSDTATTADPEIAVAHRLTLMMADCKFQ
jgi:DNA polymerase III delta prime subunit